MIRFIDMGDGEAAFFDTVTDRFVDAPDGTHLFQGADDVADRPRLAALVPRGFEWSPS